MTACGAVSRSGRSRAHSAMICATRSAGGCMLDTIASMEAIVASMEATVQWSLVVAVAPIAWGSAYFVARQFLPPDIPLWGAVFRALPAGLLLLAIRRQLPRGAWWWRSLVLGALNMGAFFALVYVA